MTIETTTSLSTNPFAVITIIAAPAVLTNATSILTLSTSTRLLRCYDRIRELSQRLETPGTANEEKERLMMQVSLSQTQSHHFLSALKAIYLSLACFAFSSFIAIIGASTVSLGSHAWIDTLAGISLASGGIGVLGLVWAGYRLIKASQITVSIINNEVAQLSRLHSLIP